MTDKMKILSVAPDGRALVARLKGSEAGIEVIKKVRSGDPINPDKDLFSLEPIAEEPNTFNVKVLYEGKKGPAKVSTDSYRAGWDLLFGRKDKGKALN